MEGIISTIASASEQRPRYQSCNFSRLEQISLQDAYQRASWTEDREKLARRRKRWSLKWSQNVESFALSRSLFDRGARLSWECTDVLGQGSFGTVGLWQQFDRNGDPVDSVAIKEILDDDNVEMARCRDYSIPMEALAMHEFRNTWSVPQLRNLIYLTSHEQARWRMYQEYCSIGNIRDMVCTYREFNRRHGDHYQLIPEIYIWFVFFGLAKAILAMDSPDFHQIQPRHQPRGHRCILHLDIKDSNVLLSDGFKHKLLSGFPVVKICDWGLANLTSDPDPRNSQQFKRYGTTCWEPPEQKNENKLCMYWHRNPHGHLYAHDFSLDAPYRVSHPMWQIAAIILGLMSLDLDCSFLHEHMSFVADPQNEAEIRARDTLLFRWTPQIQDDYSKDLCDLVGNCLKVDPRRRPSSAELLQRTKDGLRTAARKIEAKNGTIPPVFYGSNALEKMEKHVQPGKRPDDKYHVKHRRRQRYYEQGWGRR